MLETRAFWRWDKGEWTNYDFNACPRLLIARTAYAFDTLFFYVFLLLLL
jgi:hypothetical protein